MSHNEMEEMHGLLDPAKQNVILRDRPKGKLEKQTALGYFIQPRGKRLTEYEQLIGYSQPGFDWHGGGLETGDHIQKWPGGRAAYGPEYTEMKTTDWWRFRDPERRWFFPYVKAKAEEGRHTERFLKAYSEDGQMRTMKPEWRDTILADYYGAFIHCEYGMFNAHSSCTRDALSDFVRTFIAEVGFDKNDAAQMMQMQRVFMHKIVPTFPEDMEDSKALWMQDPVFKGMREAVEGLWQGTFDHMEIMWGVHGVFDALLGKYVRREYFSRMAPAYGDTLTPWILSQSIMYQRINQGGMEDLFFNCLRDDPVYGSYNQRWIKAWTAKWLPVTIRAFQDFLGIYAKLPKIAGLSDKAAIRESVARVVYDWQEDFANKISYQIDAEKMIDEIVSVI